MQVEEFIALADPKLSVFTEDEGSMEMDVLELPQHKITDFRSVTRSLLGLLRHYSSL